MKKQFKLIFIVLLVSTQGFSQDTTKYYKVELYFGLSEHDKPISETQWQSFVDNDITPSFPQGLTILDAYGQWRDDATQKIIKERSKVVIFICPKNARTTRSVEEIKKKYCHQYNQTSVLEVDTKTEKVAF